MIDTLVYGFIASIFLIFTTISMLKLYKMFPNMGIGLVWGSLFVKMLFVISYTLAVKEYVENHILYATFIFVGVVYSMVYTLISLKKSGYL